MSRSSPKGSRDDDLHEALRFVSGKYNRDVFDMEKVEPVALESNDSPHRSWIEF